MTSYGHVLAESRLENENVPEFSLIDVGSAGAVGRHMTLQKENTPRSGMLLKSAG